MEFLKEILGDDLFNQVAEKINAHNESAESKIKLADLGAGQYVDKKKFNDKETELNSKIEELGKANSLIEELKNASKNDEALQGKITSYETQVAQLQSELEKTKIQAALKVALIGEKALDVDYLTFKLNEKLAENEEHLELDENGNIKDWNSKIEGLKIQFPTQFETSGSKKIEEHILDKPDNDSGNKISKEEFAKMGYKSRVELKENNPELYKTLTE